MSRIPLLILIANLSITVFSQEFAPLNAKWHFDNCYFTDDDPRTFSIIKTVGDTVIDDKYSTIISLYKNNGQTLVTDLIIHENQGKVFFYEANKFKLFFDYNLNEGDTLSYRVPLNAPYFQSNCGGSGVDSDITYYALINDITTLDVDGIELLQFHTTVIEPQDYDGSYEFWELGIFTQRIGSPQGLFGKSAVEILGGYPGYYRCYEDDEISINFFPSIPCDITMGISELKMNRLSAEIIPNPVISNSILKIDGDFNHDLLLEIFNLEGLKLKTLWPVTPSVDLRREDYLPGIYFFRLSHKNGEFFTGKFLVK
jgi:hypothetical protein